MSSASAFHLQLLKMGKWRRRSELIRECKTEVSKKCKASQPPWKGKTKTSFPFPHIVLPQRKYSENMKKGRESRRQLFPWWLIHVTQLCEVTSAVHGDFGSYNIWVMVHMSAEGAGQWQWHLRLWCTGCYHEARDFRMQRGRWGLEGEGNHTISFIWFFLIYVTKTNQVKVRIL